MTGSVELCCKVGSSIVMALAVAGYSYTVRGETNSLVGKRPVDNQIADGHSGTSEVGTLIFSLQYPQDSQVTLGSEDDIEIVSVSPTGDPTLEIHTQARLLREDPADVVSQYIEQLLADDAFIVLYRAVAVDGRSGFRIWLGEQPDPRTGELKNSLVTFVGYGSLETAQMVSYYADEEAETAVVELHDSFTHLAPPDVLP